MNLADFADRAHRVERDVAVIGRSSPALLDLAEQVGFLADVVADLCDDLTTSSPNLQDNNLQDEWRRGMWVHEPSKHARYLLVEQDDDEIWWAVRFDVVGIANPKLCTLMPNNLDYQRCEAPEWWV